MSADRIQEIQAYLFSLSPESCNLLIGWMLVELSHTPAMAELVESFKKHREEEIQTAEA